MVALILPAKVVGCRQTAHPVDFTPMLGDASDTSDSDTLVVVLGLVVAGGDCVRDTCGASAWGLKSAVVLRPESTPVNTTFVLVSAGVPSV